MSHVYLHTRFNLVLLSAVLSRYNTKHLHDDTTPNMELTMTKTEQNCFLVLKPTRKLSRMRNTI